jgi:arginase
MRFEEVAAILRAVGAEADIVGLAITEYRPWSAIKLSHDLRSLPLLCDALITMSFGLD